MPSDPLHGSASATPHAPSMPCRRVDHQIRILVALAFQYDFRNGDADASAQLRQREAPLEMNWPQKHRAGKSSAPCRRRTRRRDWCRSRTATGRRAAISTRARYRAPPATSVTHRGAMRGMPQRPAGSAAECMMAIDFPGECRAGVRSIPRRGSPNDSFKGWRARTGAAVDCHARPRNPAPPAPAFCR